MTSGAERAGAMTQARRRRRGGAPPGVVPPAELPPGVPAPFGGGGFLARAWRAGRHPPGMTMGAP